MSNEYRNEEQMQSESFIWFWNTYPEHRQMLFHVQQQARNAVQGARFKSIGVVAGVSDMILVCLGMVVFIEFKMPDGKQSKEQVTFEQKVTARGHMYIIIRSVNEFKALILRLLANLRA